MSIDEDFGEPNFGDLEEPLTEEKLRNLLLGKKVIRITDTPPGENTFFFEFSGDIEAQLQVKTIATPSHAPSKISKENLEEEKERIKEHFLEEGQLPKIRSKEQQKIWKQILHDLEEQEKEDTFLKDINPATYERIKDELRFAVTTYR